MQTFGETRSTECSICLVVFRVPRFLPCGHTFCTPCLQELIYHCDPIYIWVTRVFRCPLCRYEVRISVGEAQGFPIDVEMIRELTNRRIMQADLDEVEVPVEGAQGFPRDGPVANRRIVQAAELPVEQAQGFPRDGQMTNRGIEQNNNASSASGWYYFVILFLILAFLLKWRSQYELDQESASWKRKFALSEQRLKRQVKDLNAGMDDERASWSSEKHKYALSVENLKRQVEDLTDKRNKDALLIRRMEKYIDKLQYPSHPILSKTFQLEPTESRAAVAMTLIDGKLLIANSINGDLKLRDAYSVTKESDWATIPSSTVAGMGICQKNGQVFVSTWNKYIFRFNRNGQLLDQWPMNTVASGVISVTDDCNVVLAVRDNSKKILIYSTYGEIINEVEMKEDITESRLIKAVQISSGRFLVSYGEGEDPEHGIDIINANGETISSYGIWKGGGIGQLKDPRDFAVDGLGNVFVADSGNGRILLLDPELKFEREVVSMKHGLQNPFGILLNECDSLLYVAENQWEPRKKKWTDGRVMVFKMK